jgi:phosphotriesterase-related protein
MIYTVRGPIPASQFGFALPHEHIMVDFIGADQTSKERWDPEEVVRTMLPYLKPLRERGVTGFVDCTPAYLGRDVRVLRRLSEETGLHIVTNTGYYAAVNGKYLPRHAYTDTVDALTARWLKEWEEGIDGTGIKPGFLKIAVNPAEGTPAKLKEVDARIVRAAARCSKRTGAAVASHTVQGLAALEQINIFEEEGVSPSRFIYVHADGEPDQSLHRQAAERGAWVEYDGIGWRDVQEHVKLILPMLEKHSDRLLISMDSGWYWVGEPNGGKIRDFNFMTDKMIPELKKAGVSEAMIRKLTVENPAKAFRLR